MRIGIDARFYGSVGKGLGRYTQKLIENLEKIDDRNLYFVFLRKANWNEYQPTKNNFVKVLADIPWYGIREQIFLTRIFRRHDLDLVHFAHFNVPLFWKDKFVVTIHDLILFHYPTRKASRLSPFLYYLKRLAYRAVIKRAILKSSGIITVSEHTKKDIMRNFAMAENKISVTYESADPQTQICLESSRRILDQYGIIKPYLLYVGNAYPHKNLERLVLVFRELIKKHPHLRLVLVGKADYFYKRLKEFVSHSQISNIVFTDYVTDAHLGTIYKEALLYVFPSLYEGFGLPPLEAMIRDIPVVSSNAACLPEVLGSAAYYFDPEALTQMAEKIEKAIVDKDLRKRLIEEGRTQLKKYSWQNMAMETKKIYEDLA